MSTELKNLRRLAERDVKDHTAIFDLYVTVGRDVEYLAIKFGMDPLDVINLLEGYGEKIGTDLDYSGKGRCRKLPRILVEEYVERFYPGIAWENEENRWICLEEYLNIFHKGWRETMVEQKAAREKEGKNRFKLF